MWNHLVAQMEGISFRLVAFLKENQISFNCQYLRCKYPVSRPVDLLEQMSSRGGLRCWSFHGMTSCMKIPHRPQSLAPRDTQMGAFSGTEMRIRICIQSGSHLSSRSGFHSGWTFGITVLYGTADNRSSTRPRRSNGDPIKN